jgi:hypothetical protein
MGKRWFWLENTIRYTFTLYIKKTSFFIDHQVNNIEHQFNQMW